MEKLSKEDLSEAERGKTPIEILNNLKSEYYKTRKMGPGWERTYKMEQIIIRMIELIRENESLKIDKIPERLRKYGEEEKGDQIEGIAYIYARPTFEFLPDLVGAISTPDENGWKGRKTWWKIDPFPQYWGIEAIKKILEENKGEKLKPAIIEELKNFWNCLDISTDRYAKLSIIIKKLEKGEYASAK